MPYGGFPATYQPYNAYQQPYYQQAQQQTMSPPTIHAEIVQVDNEQAAAAYPVGAGMSQMMIARDDSAIYIKTATANGPNLEVYVRRPPAPPETKISNEDYERIAAMVAAMMRKEETHEPV